MTDFIKGLWPQSVFAWLGLILGALSVLRLVQFGRSFGFGKTISLLLTYYDNLVHATLNWWMDPALKFGLLQLSSFLGWHLQLYPHWSHVFVLMGVYFVRAAQTNFQFGLPGTGVFRLLFGLGIGTASALAIGVVTLDKADLPAAYWIAIVPLLGFLFYEIGVSAWYATWFRQRQAALRNREPWTWWQYARRRSMNRALVTAIGAALAFALLQIPTIRQMNNPGLVVLAILLALLAVERSFTGVRMASQIREPDETWVAAYRRTSEANVGSTMIAVIIGVLAFCAANAGLDYFGL